MHVNLTSSLIAWFTQSPGVPGSTPAAADLFPWCTHNYTVTQTLQIYGIMTTEKNDRLAPHTKKHLKNDQYVKVDNETFYIYHK